MGGLFSSPKSTTVAEPSPEDAEATARKKSKARAGRIKESDTLLSNEEDKVKLLG